MKKWILHILLFASLFGMLTTSCSQDEEVMQVGSTSGTVRIQFSLDMNGNSGSRAATWGEITGDATDNNNTADTADDDIRKRGSEYENTINPNQVQVFLYQGSRFLGEVGGLNLVNTNSAVNKNIYTFTGEVTVQNATVTSGELKNATIMVVANYDKYVDGNLALNQNHMFDYTIGAYTASAALNKKYIPMWGKLNANIPLNESTASSTYISIGNIYMLRAMSKIEVVFNENKDELDNYTIEAAGLSRYNSKGNLFPLNISNDTKNINIAACFNPTAFNNVSTYTLNELGLPFEVATDKRSCIIYVPEYDYTNKASELSIYLSLKKDGQLLTAKDLPVSSGAIPMGERDLVRNHWYRYIVENINDGFDLTVETLAWTLQEIDMSFTDIVTYNVIGWTEGTYNDIGEDTHYVYMTKVGETPRDAEFVFDIVTPENPEYQIGLTNNVDFELVTEVLIDGKIKVKVIAKDTAAEYPKTALYVFVKDNYGRNVELDMTGNGRLSTADQKNVNRYTIIQNW